MGDNITFKVGDVVRLRVDGSPAMVIAAVEAEGRLLCAWKDGAGTQQSHAFPAGALRVAEPTQAAPEDEAP